MDLASSEAFLEQDNRGFVRATVPPDADLSALLRSIEVIAAATPKTGNARVLLDFMAVVQPNWSPEGTILGEHAARTLRAGTKAACVVAADSESIISGSAARRLGLNLRTFVSESDAVAWLGQ